MRLPVAVQLYSIRDEVVKDFIGALEKVAEIGYNGVEFAGFGDVPAAKMKAALDRLGLKAVGSHTGIDLLVNKLDEVMEYNLEIGNKYIVCPYDKRDSREGYMELAKLYTGIGEKCRDKGLQFCYHNHAHELQKYDGEYALDTLFANTCPDLLKAEIDTFWVYYAGLDPVEYVRKYTGRCPLLHLKDMEAGEARDFAEVGNGIINIKGLVDVAGEIGTEWLVVEQDRCKRPPLESIKISFDNLKALNAG